MAQQIIGIAEWKRIATNVAANIKNVAVNIANDVTVHIVAFGALQFSRLAENVERKSSARKKMETTQSALVKNNNNNSDDDNIDDDDDKNNNYPIVTFIRGALSSCRVACSAPQHNPPLHVFSLRPGHPPTEPDLVFFQFKEVQQRAQDGRPPRLDHGQGRQTGVGHLRPGLAPPPDGVGRGRQGRIQVRLRREPAGLSAQELLQVRTPGEAGRQRHHRLH